MGIGRVVGVAGLMALSTSFTKLYVIPLFYAILHIRANAALIPPALTDTEYNEYNSETKVYE